ncbi:MAG: Type II secretion system protein F [Chlamydiales bacterium]|nr:Type II secretion system protein F [Chlamydiales bacterium]MCH9619626.1 Type II secretion system protein F [Chlamydiales bacterium]MCH9623232.1 Type II secretion system protein F [Chlamydiales bacterium]
MSAFSYRAISPTGERKKGELKALNLQEAKDQLKQQGVVVISLKEKKFFFQKKTIGLKGEALITFTSQLSNLLSAGMPLYESLLSIAEESRKESSYPLLLSLSEQIKSGAPLSTALEAFPTTFSSLFCAMVHAGESAGSLNLQLEKLTTLLSKQNKLKKQLVTALIYPLLLTAFSFALILLLFTFVVPSLEMLFADREVNSFTRLVIGISHFTTRYPYLYLPLIGGVVSSIYFSYKREDVRLFSHRLTLKLPLIRSVIIQKDVARFTRTMGTMLTGGVSIIHALQIARGTLRSPILTAEIKEAEKRIVEGSLLSSEVKKSHFFPPLVGRMLAIGEESGKMALMLEKVADLYEEEVEKTLTRITAMAQPVILLVMGGIVGIIMMAVLLPLTDVSAFIGG